MPIRPFRRGAAALLVVTILAAGCAPSIPFERQPANGYVQYSGEPLRIAVIDQTGGDGAWRPALDTALVNFAAAAPMLRFNADAASPHITITVRRYTDQAPPVLEGYRFQPGVGGFAAVYDGEGRACNFPPSTLPLNCDGAIARAEIYLNDAIPPGAELEERRLRLLMHELGHALGLTRHSPAIDVAALTARYGW